MNRVKTAMRLHLVTWSSTVALPWLIWAAAFVINLVIFALVQPEPGEGVTGGILSGYFGVLAIYAVASTTYFSYGLSLGLSRRAFFIGTSLLALAQAVSTGILLYLISLIETATNGWGINLSFFAVPFASVDNPLGQITIYSGLALGFGLAGLFIGAVYQRWRMIGMYALGLIGVAAGGASVTLITARDGWPAFGSWFVDQSPMFLFGLVPLILAVLSTGGSYLVLRRAAP